MSSRKPKTQTAQLMTYLAKTKGHKKPRKHPQIEPRVKQVEREYVRKLLPFLKKMNELVQFYLIRNYPKIAASYDMNNPHIKRDAADDEIERAMDTIKAQLYAEFTAEQIKRIADDLGITVSELNAKFLDQGVKSVLGIDAISNDTFLTDTLGVFATQNANLITSMSDEFLGKVENLAYMGLSDGLRAEDIADQIEDLLDPLDGKIRSRAELIARDQVSKLNGQLSSYRQQEIGVERYTWRTMGDERVRDFHRALEGQVFAWDEEPPITNPQGDRNIPGGDYNCRCYAEPVLSDVVEGVDDEDDEE